MEPPSEALAHLAEDAKLPDPDKPDDPNSTVTLTADKARSIGLFLGELLDYLKIQFERCGKDPA